MTHQSFVRDSCLIALLMGLGAFLVVAALPITASAQAVFGPDIHSSAGATSPGVVRGTVGNGHPAVPGSQVSPANVPSPTTGAGGPGDNYVVSTNDSIRVDVFQEDDMTTIGRVNKEGLITMPLLGQVKVSGMTAQDIASKIRTLLVKDYFQDPHVNVTILDFTARRFILLGEVKSPGTYSIPAQETLDIVQAIAMAGGFTSIASPGRVTVVRRNGGKEETFKIDAKKMTKDGREKVFEIQPNDIITVPESFF